MACQSCRRQLTLLARQANTFAEIQNIQSVTAIQHFTPHTLKIQPPSLSQKRGFSNTPRQLGIRETLAKVFSQTAEPYRIVSATEAIYKTCAAEALYTIPEKDRKNDTIKKTAEGEDIGDGNTMWHEDFKLQPTFSTWSQVTMLHLYLVFARLRNLERDNARAWQRQLVDHFFFDMETRMGLMHGISSRGLRHRYLKDIFIQWRGAIAAYDEGVIKGDPVLAAAVWRNIFKGREDVDVRSVAAIVSWMRLCLKMLDQIPDEALHLQTQAVFKWPAKNELVLVDKPVKELHDLLAHTPPPVHKVAL